MNNIETLNKLLEDELSASEIYERALAKFRIEAAFAAIIILETLANR